MGKNPKRWGEITQTHTGLIIAHVLTERSKKPHKSWDIEQGTQDFTSVVGQN